MKRALLVLGIVACGASDATVRPPLVTTTTSQVPPAPPTGDNGRLPDLANPARYALDLTIDPRKDAFSGREQILVELLKDTAHIVMNARNVNVKSASIKIGDTMTALAPSMRPSHGSVEPDELVLSADHVLPKGRGTISISYEAPFDKTLSGLYVAKDGGEPYAFTQFESADARRAFPCFDEPGFKTPFDVKLSVPQGMIALSNGTETQKQDHDGVTTVTFSTTAPIPTYLVAFAVGHFDVVEMSPQTKPPIRFITTKGHGALSSMAMHAGAEILPLLAKYFGIAYPYDKLDLVAVPDFGAGGMENAGFITFRDDSVLLDDHASLRQRRNLIGLMTHELAHQWFGDLVTMKWWDDLWLNEGFATWATYKIVDQYKPLFGSKIEAAASATYIMDQDGLSTARAIRQPVTTLGQAMEAFDGITYQKGAAILRMIEHTVGDDAFQRGVHAYLTDHAFGNATASDLLSAIDAASKSTTHVSDLANAYLDNAGVPVVAIDKIDCAKKTALTSHLERYAPLGETHALTTIPWSVPFCVQPSASHAAASCTTLPTTPLLADAGACPLFANPDAAGYYRAFWPEKDIAPTMKAFASATPSTRVAMLADAWAQTRAGKLSGDVLLHDVLPAIDQETERHVVDRLVSILYELSELVDEKAWPAFSKYARTRLAPHLARVENPRDEDARILRRSLVYAAVEIGDDAALAKKLEDVAKAYLKNDKAIDVDYGQVALEVAARTADPAALRKGVESATTPMAHNIALRQAGGVVEASAVRSQLDWMLTPAVKLQDVRSILWPMVSHHKSRAIAIAWAREHWDALRQKLPGALSRGLVGLAQFSCTEPSLAEAHVFYTQKATTPETRIEGADRLLSQAFESASLCVALRGKLLPALQKL